MRRLAFVLAVLWAGFAAAQEQPVRVKGERERGGATVRAYNDSPIPVSVVVTLPGSENLASSETLPVVTVVPANSVVEVTRLQPLDTKKGWNYRLRYRYRWGSYTAAHDPAAMYRVPWLDGRTFTIGQAPGGPVITHTTASSREAVDVPMPEGTPVLAARAGIVFQTVADNEAGGVGESFRNKANVVRVLHADGTIGNYVHLMHGGVAVKDGERVEPGRIIGYAGNTGQSSGPHLHFAVTRVVREGEELREVSEPFWFYVGRPPKLFRPQYGLVVKADYSSPGIQPQVLRRPRPSTAPVPSAR